MQYNTVGEITMTLLNKDTLEIEDQITKKNTITYHRMLKETHVGQISGDNDVNWDTQNSAGPGPKCTGSYVGISDARLTPNIPASTFIHNSDVKVVGTTILQNWTYNYIAPGSFYLERKDRFAAPTATRSIYTVYLSNRFNPFGGIYANMSNSDNVQMDAYIGLDVPCIQTPTQILDIIYRLQYTYASVDSVGAFSGTNITKIRPDSLMQDEYMKIFYSSDRLSFPYREQLFSTTIPKEGQYNNLAGLNVDYFTFNFEGTGGYLRNRMTLSRTINDNIGDLFGMYSVCGSGNDGNNRSIFAFKAIPDSFTNKPVQPVFNHNANAPSPFLDVDNLAQSQGKVNVYNAGWSPNNQLGADFWRVTIATTGNVGESRYFLSKRKTSGFNGSNYVPRQQILPWIDNRLSNTFVRTYYGKGGLFNNIEEYTQSNNYVVGWTSLGINLFNLANGDSRIFDTQSTPMLNASSIQQVACDDIGNIWVADSIEGLFKITSPLGVSTITKVLATPCYGVDIGYSDRVWVIATNKLRYSDNYGTSWTDVTFTWEGITNNLWTNVKFIRADRSDIDHNIIIVYNNPVDSNATDQRMYAIWCNHLGVVSNAGGPFYRLCYSSGTDLGRPRTGRLRCSRYGSFWAVINNDGVANQKAQVLQLKPKTLPSLLFIGSTVNDTHPNGSNIVYFYNKNNTPFVLATAGGIHPHTSTNNGTISIPIYYYLGLYSKDLYRGIVDIVGPAQQYGLTNSSTAPYSYSTDGDYTTKTFPIIASERNSNGIFIQSDSINIRFQNIHSTNLPNAFESGTYFNGGNHNSLISEILFDNYIWNGSTWLKNTISNITNSGSLTSTTFKRYNFIPGSAIFTGKSLITSSNITFGNTKAAFLFLCNPQSKKSFLQSREHILLHFKTGQTEHSFCINGTNVNIGSNVAYTLSLSSSSGSTSSITKAIVGDNSIGRYALLGSSASVPKTYGLESFKEINGGKIHGVNSVNNIKVQETTPVMRVQDNTLTTVISYPDFNTSLFYDSLVYYISSSAIKFFGSTSITPIISEVVDHDFDVEFIRNNVSTSWVTDNFTGPTFNLMLNMSITPSNATFSSSSVIMTALTQNYIWIWFRFNELLAPRLYFCNGGGTQAFVEFTQSNTPRANDFNGTNKTSVQFRYSATTKFWTINIVSEDANTKVKTTIWTATTTQLFNNITAGVIAFNYSGSLTTAYNSGPQIENNGGRGIEIRCPAITNFVNRSTSVLKTIPGTKFDVYHNGVNIGKLESDIDLNAITNINIGNKDISSDSGFKGTLSNVQIWNTEWTATDVTIDAANPTGKTSSIPSANCLIHLPLTDSVLINELKLTHTAQESMPDNLEIKFSPGALSPAFVASDFFSVGVYDGIFKDNATSFSQHYLMHTRPTKTNMAFVENRLEVPTNIITATQIVTEPIHWNNVNLGVAFPGMFGSINSYGWNSYCGGNGIQNISTDFVFTFTSGANSKVTEFMLGMTNSVSSQANRLLLNYAVHFVGHATDNGSINIYENGTLRTTPVTTFNLNDVFSIKRTGNIITYEKNDIIFYTSTVAANGSYYPRVVTNNACLVKDIKITYMQTYPSMYLGNKANMDGIFSPVFYAIDDSYISVKLNNVPVAVTVFDKPATALAPAVIPVPSPGSCIFLPSSGKLIFDPADIGKAVTVDYTTIYLK